MTIEMAQPHAASKSNSASRAADSRFKSTHGKSQPDAAGGFQSILSAAADASSELVGSASQTSTQNANDPIGKDFKGFKEAKDTPTPITQTADPAQLLPTAPADPMVSTLTEVASVITATPSNAAMGAANQQVDALTSAPALLMPQQFNPTIQSQSVQVQPVDTGVSASVSALLSQSRFTQYSSGGLVAPQANAATSAAIAPVADALPAPISFTPAVVSPQPMAQNLSSPTTPTPAQAPTPLAAAIVTNPVVVATLQPTPAQAPTPLAAAVSTNASLVATQQPTVQPSTQLNSVIVSDTKKSAPTAPEIASILPQGRFAATSSSAASKATLEAGPAVATPSTSPKSSVSPGEELAKPPAKNAGNMVPDGFAQFAPIYALPIQSQPTQLPPSVVANQEMKALEAVKATTIPANAAPIARLAGLDAQEKQGKTAGLNEFKPWSPGSFSSTVRMSDTSSGANTGKDASSNAAALTANAVTPQPLAPESKFTQSIEPNQIAPTPLDSLVAPAVTTALETLREEHAVFKSNQPDALPDLQSFQLNGVEGAPTVATSEGAVPLETYVAEQVTYWISQDVQNAELKLEGIGIDPVQVNITMQGNEAFVTFTTDEVQAREALENAREQLKEMLLSQGVVLSGVSVGSSGAKDSGGQDRNPRQGNKQTLVTPVQSDMQENKPRAGRISGSTLDLFV